MIKNLLIGIVAILGIVALLFSFQFSLDRSEQGECEQWKEEARQLTGYYVVAWQVEQCAAHNIDLGAAVVK